MTQQLSYWHLSSTIRPTDQTSSCVETLGQQLFLNRCTGQSSQKWELSSASIPDSDQKTEIYNVRQQDRCWEFNNHTLTLTAQIKQNAEN